MVRYWKAKAVRIYIGLARTIHIYGVPYMKYITTPNYCFLVGAVIDCSKLNIYGVPYMKYITAPN